MTKINKKITLLKQLVNILFKNKCDIYSVEYKTRLTNLGMADAVDFLYENGKLENFRFKYINEFWKEFNEELRYCNDVTDMKLTIYCQSAGNLDISDEDYTKIWKIYVELKKVWNTQILSRPHKKVKKEIKGVYGTHFNPWKQGQ